VARPYIICVDDDLAVLNAVDRDLRQKYGRDYRIVKAGSADEAMSVLTELQQRNEQVALFVVDQRMPSITGVELLQKAMPLFPDARKVLLTAYADTSAAITAINVVGLDYYLMKPWDPPEDNLYPVLDGLLDDWNANTKPPFEGIRIFGAMWSPACHDVKNFLSRHSIPYQWLDVDRDPANLRTLEELVPGTPQLPVLLMPNGAKLVQPTPQEIAQQVGLSTRAESPHYDVVIIGAGPAGLSAAVYASSDGLDVLLIERELPGGQAGSSPKIENFLGFPAGISGQDLTRRALTQAQRLGAEFLTTHSVTGIRLEGDTKIISLSDGSEISAKIILVATGAWFRTLELPAMERWNGAGVYYGAARTEAVNFRDTDVIAIGGANSAAQGILFLAKFVRSVKVLIRGQEPSWSQYLDTAIRSHPKVELMFGCQLDDLVGDEELKAVRVKRTTGEEFELPASAVFVFIGQRPQSDFLGDLVIRTPSGHILTGPDLTSEGAKNPAWPLAREPMTLETSVPGIFAAGDVRNGTKHGVAAAVGDGNVAALLFWHYLSTI
jgi:thioredoxin reductase (NADPH)